MAAVTATQMNFNGISQVGQSRDLYPRHIPIKRIAACPPSDHIVAEAKRSRLLYPPNTGMVQGRMAATPLTVRSVHNENVLSSTVWAKANCFQSYSVVNSTATSCVSVAKGLRYDPVNSGNIQRMAIASVTPMNEPKRARCCPIMTTATAYSTPPYCVGGSDLKKPRRRPLSQKLKRRSWDGKKAKMNGVSPGCLPTVQNAAVNSVKTLKTCVEKTTAQSEMNALSVYHAFLKEREEVTKATVAQRTNSTVLEQEATSRRSSHGEVRYSSNFVPQLTSTPQKGKRAPSCAETRTSEPRESAESEARVVSGASDQPEAISFTEILKALEEERRSGTSHIMLPIPELEDIVRNYQKQTTGGAPSSCGSSGLSHEPNNNNNKPNNNLHPDEFRCKEKSRRRVRPKLPGMYPIGAPRDASSPISASKAEFRVFDESAADRSEYAKRKRHAAGDQQVPSTSITSPCYDDDVWRPW